MRNVSQAWKDIYNQCPDYAYGQYEILYPYKTLDLIPESNMLVVLGGEYTRVKNTVASDYSGSAYTVNSAYRLGANHPKEIATYETKRACFGLNEFVLDGSCSVSSDESLKFYSDVFSDGNCEFDDEIYFQLQRMAGNAAQGLVSFRFYPEINEYATDYDIYNGDGETDYTANYTNEENKQNYLHNLTNYSSSSIVGIKVNKWNFPYTRAKLSQMVWGRQVIFDKTNIESLTYVDSINPVNDELPCQTLTVNAFDYDREWDVHSNAYIGSDVMLSRAYLYAMYNTKNGWERISLGYFAFDSMERLQNGNTVRLEFLDPLQKCKDTTKVWRLHLETEPVKSVVDVLTQINNHNTLPVKFYIRSSDYSELKNADTDVSFGEEHDWFQNIDSTHYTAFTLAELIQNIASMVGGTIVRGESGSTDYYITNLKNNTFVDTIRLHTEYRYPEIANTINFDKLIVAYEELEKTNPNGAWTYNNIHIEKKTVVYNNPALDSGEELTLENRLSLPCGDVNFPDQYKSFYVYYMLSRKEYDVECVINPAWQAGDKVNIQTREATTAEQATTVNGLMTRIEINYNGTFRGKVEAMKPYSWTYN